MSYNMSLSPETIAILKSFSGIQSNVVFTGGSTIQTMGESKTILGSAKVSETFPEGLIGIFDLSEFLGVLKMFDQPELQFDEDFNFVHIYQGDQSVRYYLSDPEMLTYPRKTITLPSTDLTFQLSKENLASIRRASSVMSAPDMVVVGVKGEKTVRISVTDTENPTSNTFSINLRSESEGLSKDPGAEFSLVFKVSNLNKLIGDTGYTIDVSRKMISNFKSLESPIQYWVALSKESTYTDA